MMKEGSDDSENDLELNLEEETTTTTTQSGDIEAPPNTANADDNNNEPPKSPQHAESDHQMPSPEITAAEAATSSEKIKIKLPKNSNTKGQSKQKQKPSNTRGKNDAIDNAQSKTTTTHHSNYPQNKRKGRASSSLPDHPGSPISPSHSIVTMSPRLSPGSPLREKLTSPMTSFFKHVKRSSGFDAGATSDDDSEFNLGPAEMPSLNDSNPAMTLEDIEICQKLDEEYERALEEREIGYNARYASVRQSAFLSVFFMASYMMLGTAFFMRQADWSVPDSLLFSIYTITTVGYGHHEIPTTPGFQAYTIFYILIGIASLTIMVAQVYQCIALEASRAQHSRDRTEMERRGLDILNVSRQGDESQGDPNETASDEIIAHQFNNMPGMVDQAFRYYDRSRKFFRETELGRSVSVLFPFAGLILIGAIVVGPIEGWTPLESIYFAVVSLTTVGFGDYHPRKLSSIWFCIFWLPFSIGFMSMFLGNVAAFYIRLSDRNIRRIERHMRRRLERAKRLAELERAEVLKRAYRGQESMIEAANTGESPDETSDRPTIPQHHAAKLKKKTSNEGHDVSGSESEADSDDDEGSHQLFGSSPVDSGITRRERFLTSTSNQNDDEEEGKKAGTMQSMRDVLKAVHRSVEHTGGNQYARKNAEFMSIRSSRPMKSHAMPSSMVGKEARKPSFALRVLVQERFSQIIAVEVAGYQSSIEIKDNTLSVTIESLHDTADKWLIPRRARKAFRAAAFEVLYFVGEHGLITRGAEALYDLTPFEFHGLFNPLLASMGDAETMESWLASTEVLADVDLKRDSVMRPSANIAAAGIRTDDHFEQLPGAPPQGNRASAAFSRLTPSNAFSIT